MIDSSKQTPDQQLQQHDLWSKQQHETTLIKPKDSKGDPDDEIVSFAEAESSRYVNSSLFKRIISQLVLRKKGKSLEAARNIIARVMHLSQLLTRRDFSLDSNGPQWSLENT